MKLFDKHEEYLRPLWQGGLITNESILPLYKPGESGELSIRLMNDIKSIVSVKTATLDREFCEGKDYYVRDKQLVIPEGSAIRVMPWSEYNPAEGRFACKQGGALLFGESNRFHSLQYSVTYESDGNLFDGAYSPKTAPELSGARRILESGERDLKLAFFGDSITYGCNASGLYAGLPPYMPCYPLLAAEGLRRRGFGVDYCNPSIGGKSSPWGRDTAAYYFDGFKPDLTVIAFGMNDGTGKLPVADFTANIASIVSTIRKSNPAAEFILVSTTLPNELSFFKGLQEDYEKPLADLAEAEGCAFLNMTELHRRLLTRKEYHHMTGNNINHPSDFLARFYAAGVLALLGK